MPVPHLATRALRTLPHATHARAGMIPPDRLHADAHAHARLLAVTPPTVRRIGPSTRPAQHPTPGGEAYCGKMRSKNLSGASFVCYDGGHKPGEQTKQGGPRAAAGGQPRRQMAAVVFNKARRRHRADERRCNQPYAPQAAVLRTPGCSPTHPRLQLCAPRLPFSAPRLRPSAPRLQPSAPRLRPSAPRLPPSAPRLPPSAPRRATAAHR